MPLPDLTRPPAKADRTRAAVLDAAERLFARRGYAATRLEDVAEAVGVKRAALFYHFRDKQALYDAIHQATGSTTRLPGARVGTRVAALPDSNVNLDDGFLDLFGKPPRESSCECERTSGMSLGQSLNLVNGPTVGEAIRDPRNSIADFLAVAAGVWEHPDGPQEAVRQFNALL